MCVLEYFHVTSSSCIRASPLNPRASILTCVLKYFKVTSSSCTRTSPGKNSSLEEFVPGNINISIEISNQKFPRIRFGEKRERKERERERERETATTATTTTKGMSGVAQVAVLGASGYTGSEITRLLALHPKINVRAITSERSAGQPFASSFPHLRTERGLCFQKVQDVKWDEVDSVFCCLPHGTTQEIIAKLPRGKKVVDLSADFRLKDVEEYAEWYGGEHKAPELQKEVVYGLTEFKRKEVEAASLVANPGCYPTSIQLPLIPLLREKLITTEDIIIDAKSGVR